MKLYVASALARFGLVLRVGASTEPEAQGIQRYILELGLDRFSALEVAQTILCLDLKSGDLAPCSVGARSVGGFSLLVKNSN